MRSDENVRNSYIEKDRKNTCIQPADAVLRVGVVTWLRALLSYELHDFVFTLAWNGGI